MEMLTLAEYLAKMAAAIGAVGTVATGGFYAVRKGRKWWIDGNVLISDLRVVVAEVKPNHGASLRDAVNRIETLCNATAESAHLGSQRWRAAQDTSVLALADMDDLGAMRWQNRTFRELVGREEDELRGHGWVNAVTPSMRTWVREAWSLAVKEARDFEERIVFETQEAKRRRVCCNVRATKMDRLDGSLAGHSVIVTPCNDMVHGEPCGACYTASRFGITPGLPENGK